MRVDSHVLSIGDVHAEPCAELPDDLNAAVDSDPVRCLDPAASERMQRAIDRAKEEGDTLGGVFEVVARGVPAASGAQEPSPRGGQEACNTARGWSQAGSFCDQGLAVLALADL